MSSTKPHRLRQTIRQPTVIRERTDPRTILTSGLLCGGGFAIRSIAFSPTLKTVQQKEEEVAEMITEYIDKTYPKMRWREFLKLISTEIWFLLAAVLCAIAVAAINVKIPLLLGDIIDVLNQSSAESVPRFMKDVSAPAKKLLVYYLAHGAWTFSYITLITKVGERIAKKLRVQLFSTLIQQDISFFDQHKSGELLDRLTSDIQEFKSSFKLCMSQGLKAVTQTIGCSVSLVILSPQLSLSICIILPCIVTVGTMFGSFLRQFSQYAQSQMAKATGIATEAINNVRTVRAFAMEPNEMQLYDDGCRKAQILNMRLGFGIAIFQALTNITINGVLLGVLYCGGLLMARDQLSPGDLMSFLVATQTIQKSLAQMSVLVGQAVKGASAGGRVFEFISLTPTIPLTGGLTIPYHSLYGHIAFNKVSFTYPSRLDQEVLKNFTLDIRGGQKVALVGPSGGGKSTVAMLLERFYDVDSGTITIDGHDLTQLDPSWLRGGAIGFINQEPVLFATSVMENIRYGNPAASDIEVKEAANLANAHDFINNFPEGYHTLVGERGVTLSGGQKQRIAIARALIKNPSILILDEATSSLDAESEKVVQEALDKASKGRTVIVIAHRLSTVKNADLIAVMAEGRIVESGTHESLSKQKGAYWQLIKQQALHEHHGSPGSAGIPEKRGILLSIWDWARCK